MTTRAPRKPDIEHPGETDMFSRHRPSYSSMCRHCARAQQRELAIGAIFRSLRDFGYTNLTRDEAAAAFDLAMTRKPTAADGIIAMLTRTQLEQAAFPGLADADADA